MTVWLDRYCRFLKVALTLMMGFMIIPIALQILTRHTGLLPRYIWTEEVARFCFVWIVMIGSIIAVRDGAHFDVDVLPEPRSRRARGVLRIIAHAGMMLMALVFAWYGVEFAKLGFRQTSEMSGINMLSIYISFPIAGFSWILFLTEHLAADVRWILEPDAGGAT